MKIRIIIITINIVLTLSRMPTGTVQPTPPASCATPSHLGNTDRDPLGDLFTLPEQDYGISRLLGKVPPFPSK